VRRAKPETRYLKPGLWHEFKDRFDMAPAKESTSLADMLHRYMSGLSLKDLLRYEDRNSMRFSIEARTPFADDVDLIESVFRIPEVYKIHNGWSKFLLREATAGVVPDEIRQRTDKVGFATPEYRWLTELKDEFRGCIGDEMGDFLDVKRLRKDWDRLIEGESKSGITSLWKVVNLALWRKVNAI
jgi:asparagine synthase (glutamine-hydrolysing)